MSKAVSSSVRGRISSIEFFRAIAIFAIILLHTSPFRESDNVVSRTLYIGIDNLTRFAVPFFFVVAGYFLGKKIQSGIALFHLIKVYASRLLPLFILWSIIYLVSPLNIKKEVMKYGLWQAIYHKLGNALADPLVLFLQGGRGHLWFLMSLFMSITIIIVLLQIGRKQWIAPVSILLYLFGLIAGPYSVTSLGIHVPFNTVNGPFFSTIFVAAGWVLSSEKYQIRPVFALGLALIGMVMHMLEVLCLWRFYSVLPIGRDYVFGTFLWAFGLTMFVLSRPRLFESSVLSKWGRYVMGIYLVHLLVLDVLTPLALVVPFPLWDLMNPFIIYSLSLLVVLILFRNRLTRYFVAY